MIKTIFIILVIVGSCWNLLLSILNYASRNNPIPECVKDVYDEKTYCTWKEYQTDLTKNSIIYNIITTIAYVAILISNILPTLASKVSNGLFMQTLVVLGSFTIIDSIFSAINSYVKNFKIEAKYGFNKMTMKTFISDEIKGFIISIILSVGLVSLFGVIHRALQDGVILLFTGIMIVFVLLVMFLYPKLSRIFNKFTPLEDGSLKTKLINLLESHNYHVKELNVMDASKRSTKSNAYFSGFGKTKTIVLYDTLIQNMSEDEIVAVFAHELGHGLHKDTLKNSFLSFLNVALIVICAYLLVNKEMFCVSFGFTSINYGFVFILLSLAILPIVSPLIGFVSSFASRKAEYLADKQAVLEGYGEQLISALKKLGRENFANLSPNKLVVLLSYSHPTLAQRIEAIRNMK